MKALFYDLETTGVDYTRHGIHQISGMIEVDDNIVSEFDFKVRPRKDAIIEPSAMDVGNVTAEDIMAYPEMKSVYLELTKRLGQYVDKYNRADKYFLIGYNSNQFDNQFFRAFFTDNGDQYFGSYFWSNAIDVMVLASEYLKHERHTMPNFKQSTVARKLGIDVDETKLHDAVYDISIMRAIYKKVVENGRQ